ncbi:MAG: hypothetical protein R3266_14450, partial [Gemmatimonadota bacterium]|nr:hypothetical protein [Gemmatimonadota bacterium]
SDRPLAEIAAELGVDYVVEGTVTFSGSGARVSTDLIDVARERPLWNESYDLTLVAADVFGTQSAIAARVAGELRAELSDEETAELARRPTNDFEAWASTQRGIELWQQARDSADYAASLEAFEEAIARDSTYAAPYVGVLLVLENGAVNGHFGVESTLPRARAAGRHALALDPGASLEFGVTAASLLAALRFWFDWDFEGTRDEVTRLQASGGDLGPLFWFLSAIGDHDGAISFVAGRAEGNPASPFFRRVLASRLYDARRYEAAAEAARQALALSPEPLPRARSLLGRSSIRAGAIEAGLEELERAAREEPGPAARAYVVHGLGLAGRGEEARARFEELRSDVGVAGIPLGVRWLAHLGAGDREAAIDALEAAARERNFIVLLLGQDPDADPLRGHPRFTALMDRIGIPESARIEP